MVNIFFFKNTILGNYIKEFTKLMPKKVALNIFLMVLVGLTEGIGLLLLIPLLQLIGLDTGQGSLNQISELFSTFFSALGLNPTLITVLIVYVVVVSFIALLNRWQMLINYQIDFQFAAYLRKRLYKAITNSNWLFFSSNKSSDFAHALTNEIERVGTGTSQFLTLLASIILITVYFIFALKLSGLITAIIFISGLLLLIILRKKTYLSQQSGQKVTETTRDIYSSLSQHLDGMKTIKSFGLQEENFKLFSKQTDEVVESYINSIRSYANVKLLFDIGIVIILSIIVVFLIQIVQTSTATLLLLIYIFVRMVPQLTIIQSSYQYVLNMLPAFSNIKNLERSCMKNTEMIEYTTKGIELKEEVKVNDISFFYNSDHFVMDNLNLRIVAGKTTAIVGPSGAGKSTIADLVMGLLQPERGIISVDGVPISQFYGSWRNTIGYVDQETFLFNESIRFNILVSQPIAEEKDIIKALKAAAAYEFVCLLPNGLNTIIGDRGVRLSGGERQRLALARALLKKPSLLILDEATSNLDSENEKRIINAIDDLHGETTILIIAHRISTIKNADYIYIIEKGQIKEEGTWDELVELKGKFKNMCESQGL